MVKQVLRKVLGAIGSLYRTVLNLLLNNRVFKYRYYRLSVFLATRGIKPFFSCSDLGSKRRWKEQGDDGAIDVPETYVGEDNSLAELFRDVLPYLDKQSPVLELGCNVGRSLDYLYRHGYTDLTGVEIGPKAVELSKTVFPDMYEHSRLIVGDVTEVIKTFAKDQFELVFCHSVLVNIHPKHNHIFKDMARISRKFILILENEGSYNAYPKDFKKLVEKQGYKMIVSKVFTGNCACLPMPYKEEHIYKNNTIRLFVKDESGL
ncbi:MAG: class I SAM-dependent methyltransferase [Candidatus Saganbacteria bacterium]|nr:class I SAM-dependent methyltransferase [Candidatus Saganbacteria bacterium]